MIPTKRGMCYDERLNITQRVASVLCNNVEMKDDRDTIIDLPKKKITRTQIKNQEDIISQHPQRVR